jgi:tripartite-type tricarboxylate transporter receptor subunit TctC
VASVTDLQANLTEVALPAHALGVPLRFTGGYRGSGDRLAAVMRGEVDITVNSLTTSVKASRSGDIASALLISDAPEPSLPGVPFLAGRGGLVDRVTAGRPAAERAEALRLAAVAVDTSRVLRAVFVSARVPEPARACLAALVWEVLSGEEFIRASAAVGRPVRPEDRDAAQAAIDRLLDGVRSNRDLLRRLLHDATR